MQCLYALSLHLLSMVFGTAIPTSLYIFGKCFIYLCVYMYMYSHMYIHACIFTTCSTHGMHYSRHALLTACSTHGMVMWWVSTTCLECSLSSFCPTISATSTSPSLPPPLLPGASAPAPVSPAASPCACACAWQESMQHIPCHSDE